MNIFIFKRVEPPTPAFSGAAGAMLATTYKDVEGCETPVRTGKTNENRAGTTGCRRHFHRIG
jgi:hypothetical protein